MAHDSTATMFYADQLVVVLGDMNRHHCIHAGAPCADGKPCVHVAAPAPASPIATSSSTTAGFIKALLTAARDAAMADLPQPGEFCYKGGFDHGSKLC